jgi:hypothetical protein
MIFLRQKMNVFIPQRMNRDALRLIASFLRGDDLVAFTGVSRDCYLAVGQPAPVPKWDVYRAVRELDTLALRRHKIDLFARARKFEFNVLFHMHKEYEPFACLDFDAEMSARYRACDNKTEFVWTTNFVHQYITHDMELVLSDRASAIHPSALASESALEYHWQEILYRNDPALMQTIIRYGGGKMLAYYVYSHGSLRAIKTLNSSIPFSSFDLRKNPHEDAVRHMIRAMKPYDCFDEYTPRSLAEKILEAHGCTTELANRGLICTMMYYWDCLEDVQFWIAQGATITVAAATKARGKCAQWLMERPEVRAAADIVCMASIKDKHWNCDSLVPYLKQPEVIASIACAFDYELALLAIPCGCPRHT